MAIVFSPISQEELSGPFKPYPKSAFLMMHSGENISVHERYMIGRSRSILGQKGASVLTAVGVPGTGDYLLKIIQLIQGSGFGVAIYSENTPARTLGNIFFEIGVCLTLGKPVQIVMSGDEATPSDFARNEWVKLNINNKRKFSSDLNKAFDSVFDYGLFTKKLGDIALAAQDTDFELAFERFKQSILISNAPNSREAIEEIRVKLAELPDEGNHEHLMKNHRFRLLTTIREFQALLEE